MTMTPLHRHQLAWLAPAGWARVRERTWDAVARDCLAHWAREGLPLVVTRQPREFAAAGLVALGLPAPRRWDRRRMALEIPRSDVLYFDEFPRADRMLHLIPPGARNAWRALCAGLLACGARARVHGSYGWQHLSGLEHVHGASDVDLCINVANATQADAVAAQLQAFGAERPRLDGELVFPDGRAVAWREWCAWRAGDARTMLVKHLHGSALASDLGGQRSELLAEVTA
jgi:phosphoribosyl-dephospho-CoA transferase